MSRTFYLGLSVLTILFGLSSNSFAASDAPSGFTKCGRDGDTCSFSGTREVAYGKSGNFVYRVHTGPITCGPSMFPSIDLGGKRGYCSYSGSQTSSSSSTSGSTSSGGSSSSSSSSSGSSSSGGSNKVTIQENSTGFCGVDGSVDSNNSGYTGSGFANTDNSNGKGVTWSVSGDSGSYTLRWRYANGGSSNRSGVLSENGSNKSTEDFNGTGSWTSWSTSSVTLNLSGGTKTLRLQANQGSGLGNIDYLEVTGPNAKAASCSGSSSSSGSSTSSSSSGSSSSGGNGNYGSSCNGGSTTTVSSTIRVEDGGTFDGGCKTYNGGGSLGDGSQSESQDPIFRVGPGKIRNVYIGSNGADGIHSRNGGDVENILWSDVGEDAMTIKSPTNGATVEATKVEGYDSADKFFQANDDAKWIVKDCRVDNAGKFVRQNGGSTFPLHMEVSNCYISNMKEGVFRSDSPNSTARITNSRLSNAGDICIGKWKSCTSSGISN
ncbi:Carbohydrate binding module (family 6) [Alteromonadaceae bacterium Bs31]|nr:Carbohydrate binding module (family 6) [Alteromonadaceae bacterium Bs31]